MAKGSGKKPPRAPKTKKDAPGAAAVQGDTPGPGHNGDSRTEDEIRQGFLHHRTAWNGWMAKVKALEIIEKDVKAALKADGYTVGEMKIADQLAGSPKAEAKVVGEVETRLRVAKWIGHPMGNQMDLFAQPDRTPSVDRSFDMGKQASMENKPCKPPHSPETEQYRSWVQGWQQHQAQLGKGFKAPQHESATEEDAGADDAKEPEEEITSGERVSRSQFSERLKNITGQEPDGAPRLKH